MFDLLPGEKVIVGIRKHWLVFFLETIGLFIAAAVPVILLPFYSDFFSETVTSLGVDRFQNLAVFLVAGWFLLMLVTFFVMLTGYYLDILIVTNERLIDVDQLMLFSRDITTAPLEKIEDVKVQTLGILATIFKFGNINIQTAAEEREMLIKGLRYPEYARDVIMKAYEENKARKL